MYQTWRLCFLSWKVNTKVHVDKRLRDKQRDKQPYAQDFYDMFLSFDPGA